MVLKYVFCVLVAIQLINAAVVQSYDNKDTLYELQEKIFFTGSTCVKKGEDLKISFHADIGQIREIGVIVGQNALQAYEMYKNTTINDHGEWARECFDTPQILRDLKSSGKELLNDFERCIANATYQVDSIAFQGIKINQAAHDQVNHWDDEYYKCDGDVKCQDGVLDTLKDLAEKVSGELSQLEADIQYFNNHGSEGIEECEVDAFNDLGETFTGIQDAVEACLSAHQ
ncbi:uncharacterized protein [Atheta coriaria]|uniref:uncharacterized protein n=1 Tax=Dalotia coriaria TaxID=877792 RepID=UPI0031F35EEB